MLVFGEMQEIAEEMFCTSLGCSAFLFFLRISLYSLGTDLSQGWHEFSQVSNKVSQHQRLCNSSQVSSLCQHNSPCLCSWGNRSWSGRTAGTTFPAKWKTKKNIAFPHNPPVLRNRAPTEVVQTTGASKVISQSQKAQKLKNSPERKCIFSTLQMDHFI